MSGSLFETQCIYSKFDKWRESLTGVSAVGKFEARRLWYSSTVSDSRSVCNNSTPPISQQERRAIAGITARWCWKKQGGGADRRIFQQGPNTLLDQGKYEFFLNFSIRLCAFWDTLARIDKAPIENKFIFSFQILSKSRNKDIYYRKFKGSIVIS